MFRQTLSDINLDRSKVKSDKLLYVNTALVFSGNLVQSYIVSKELINHHEEKSI